MCVVPGIGPAVLTAHRDTVIVHAIGPPVLTAHKDTVLHLCVCCTWDGKCCVDVMKICGMYKSSFQ